MPKNFRILGDKGGNQTHAYRTAGYNTDYRNMALDHFPFIYHESTPGAQNYTSWTTRWSDDHSDNLDAGSPENRVVYGGFWLTPTMRYQSNQTQDHWGGMLQLRTDSTNTLYTCYFTASSNSNYYPLALPPGRIEGRTKTHQNFQQGCSIKPWHPTADSWGGFTHLETLGLNESTAEGVYMAPATGNTGIGNYGSWYEIGTTTANTSLIRPVCLTAGGSNNQKEQIIELGIGDAGSEEPFFVTKQPTSNNENMSMAPDWRPVNIPINSRISARLHSANTSTGNIDCRFLLECIG